MPCVLICIPPDYIVQAKNNKQYVVGFFKWVAGRTYFRMAERESAKENVNENKCETPQSLFSPSMLFSFSESVSNCLFDLLLLLEHV